jgi:hypothetical protein
VSPEPVLLALLRGGPLPAAPLSETAWDRVIALAEAEEVVGGLAHALRAHGWADVPATTRAALERRFTEALGRHTLMMRDLAALLRELRGAGIEAMPLKGPVLAEQVYPHPAARMFSDLDVLVRPADVERTDAVVRGLGWRRAEIDHAWDFDVAYEGAAMYVAPGRASIDVHWHLLNEPRYPWNRAATDALWARAVPAVVAGEPTRILADEDLVVYLAVHLGVHHVGAGLRWQLDLAWLVRRRGHALEWSTVVQRAREWRMARATAFGLACAAARVGLDVPSGVIAALRGRGSRAACASILARVSERGRRRIEHLVPLVLADHGRDAVHAFRDALLPSRAWLAARYRGRAGGTLGRYLAHYGRLGAILLESAGRRATR